MSTLSYVTQYVRLNVRKEQMSIMQPSLFSWHKYCTGIFALESLCLTFAKLVKLEEKNLTWLFYVT